MIHSENIFHNSHIFINAFRTLCLKLLPYGALRQSPLFKGCLLNDVLLCLHLLAFHVFDQGAPVADLVRLFQRNKVIIESTSNPALEKMLA